MPKSIEELGLLPYDIFELPEKEKQEKMIEIGENEQSKKTCLNKLTEMIRAQTEFRPCMDHDFLLRFLRHSKFDWDKAFNRLKKFYFVQKKYPDYFEYNASSALSKAKFNHVYISPYRMQDNSVLYIHKFFREDMSILPAKDKFYLDTLITDELLEKPINQMCGSSFIMDLKGMTISKIFHYSPQLLRMHFEVLQNSFPYRVKAIHVVNSSSIFIIFYNIAYPLMPKKLQQRLRIHSDNKNWTDLHAFIPPEILPKEYGGYLEDSSMLNAMDNIYEKEKNFRKVSPYVYLEH